MAGFIRELHHWGASAVIMAVGLHMLQVFFDALFLLPFLDRNPERHPSSRPITLSAGLGLLGISLKQLYAVPRKDPAIVRGIELVEQAVKPVTESRGMA